MKQPTDMGLNRSGLATAPVMAPSMLEVPALTHPTHKGEEVLFAEERISYSKEGEQVKEKEFTFYRTHHGPITHKSGEKWVATKWLRQGRFD